MAKDAEKVAAANNKKDLFNVTRKIAGSARSITVAVKSLDGQLVTNVDW